jgi:hypothetical protein
MPRHRTTVAAVICFTLGLVGAASPTVTSADHRRETDHGKTFAAPPEGAKKPTGSTPA